MGKQYILTFQVDEAQNFMKGVVTSYTAQALNNRDNFENYIK